MDMTDEIAVTGNKARGFSAISSAGNVVYCRTHALTSVASAGGSWKFRCFALFLGSTLFILNVF